MSKEIRDGVEKFISEAYWYEGEKNIVVSITDELLAFLDKKGVVIKKDGERLEYKFDYPDSHFEGRRPSFIFALGQVRRNNQMAQAGYVAVEPLIEEGR